MSSEREGNRWLRNHFHEFVFPAFIAAGQKSSEIGKPFDIRPAASAPEILPTELKKLWTLCMEHKVPWAFDVREKNMHSGSSKYRESARIHHKILHATLDSTLAALRDEHCDRLFLGGRDVWTFAVLSSRRRIPYLYVPELSRGVSSKAAVKPFLESLGFTGDELFLDTGFAGSIPRNLQGHWKDRQFKFRLMSQSDVQVIQEKPSVLVDTDPSKGGPLRKLTPSKYRRKPNQLFPNRSKAREEALETEYLAKYWRAGTSELIYPAEMPLIGHALAVFQEWKDKPGVRRYSKLNPPNIPGAIKKIGLWDGVKAIEVGFNDLKIAPGFHEWWLTLPEEKDHIFLDVWNATGERICQYFSDRETIQRAALLTSMLWRGIPFWKAAMQKETPKAMGNTHYDNQAITNQIINAQMVNAVVPSINSFTVGTGNIYTFPNFTGTVGSTSVTQSSVTQFSNNIAVGANSASTTAIDPNHQVLQQMVMQAAASLVNQQAPHTKHASDWNGGSCKDDEFGEFGDLDGFDDDPHLYGDNFPALVNTKGVDKLKMLPEHMEPIIPTQIVFVGDA